ncbi:MAG: hypothetical protein EBT60_04105 [Bacteroidetes bacterium]|nr:hypothetical protein [Bacteroidota bacterium]
MPINMMTLTTIPNKSPYLRACFCLPPGALLARIEMKMMLSIPNTISKTVKATKLMMISCVMMMRQIYE